MTNLTSGYEDLGRAASSSDTYTPADVLLAGSFPLDTSAGTLLDQNAVLPAFSLVGRITASGKLTLSAQAASDGSQVPVGVTIVEYPDTGADIPNVTFYRSGNFNFDALNLGAGWTLANLRVAVENSGVPLFFGQPATATPTV